MIFHSANQKVVYFSSGKVGSSSIARSLEQLEEDNDWRDDAGKYTLGEFINLFKGYKLNVVIRNPYERWKSGFKENTLGPHLYGTTPLTSLQKNNETIFNYMEFDHQSNIIEKHSHNFKNTNLEIPIYINPKYSNSIQFWTTMLTCQLQYCNYDFSLGNNVHTANWLWKILILSKFFTVNLIYGDVLDHLRAQYGDNDIIHNKNVTDRLAVQTFDNVIRSTFKAEMNLKTKLNKYLEPENYLYDVLMDDLKNTDDTLSVSDEQFIKIFKEYYNLLNSDHKTIDFASVYKQDIKQKVLEVVHTCDIPELLDLFK
jgi:hypothetical protein